MHLKKSKILPFQKIMFQPFIHHPFHFSKEEAL